jgi:hypothetical protein
LTTEFHGHFEDALASRGSHIRLSKSRWPHGGDR